MGLFDALEAVASGSGQGSPAPPGAVEAVAQMVQRFPGGIGGLVQQFEKAGLGGVAQTWLSLGSSQTPTGDQVKASLGDGPVAELAAKLGVPQDQAAGHIAQLLPLIVDHLSPTGTVPQGGGLGALEGLLTHFGSAGPFGGGAANG
jgi:uncharacterized protein YidB (DUF937 family)